MTPEGCRQDIPEMLSTYRRQKDAGDSAVQYRRRWPTKVASARPLGLKISTEIVTSYCLVVRPPRTILMTSAWSNRFYQYSGELHLANWVDHGVIGQQLNNAAAKATERTSEFGRGRTSEYYTPLNVSLGWRASSLRMQENRVYVSWRT